MKQELMKSLVIQKHDTNISTLFACYSRESINSHRLLIIWEIRFVSNNIVVSSKRLSFFDYSDRKKNMLAILFLSLGIIGQNIKKQIKMNVGIKISEHNIPIYFSKEVVYQDFRK